MATVIRMGDGAGEKAFNREDRKEHPQRAQRMAGRLAAGFALFILALATVNRGKPHAGGTPALRS